MDDLVRVESISKDVQCSNCASDLTEGYVDSYALPITGKTITAYEALQIVFKGYETSSNCLIPSDQIKFCNICGNVFGQLLRMYTRFLELSTLESYIHNLVNGFPHQFVTQPDDGTSQVPLIVNVNSRLHIPCQLNSVLYPEYEDVKIETEDFSNTTHLQIQRRRPERLKKPSSSSTLNVTEPSDDDENQYFNNFTVDDPISTDSDLNFFEVSETNTKKASLKARRIRKKQKPAPRRSRQYRCHVCSSVFKHYEEFKFHKADHEGIQKYPCSHCHKCFLKRNTLTSHERLTHQVTRVKGMQRSDKSDKVAGSEEDLALLVYKEYKCNTEGCETLDLPSFKKWILHQKEIHQLDMGYKDIEKQRTVKPKDRLFRPCPRCGVKIKSNAEMIRHIKHAHLNLRPFKCSVCMNTFVTQHDLNYHMENVHTEPKYLCNLCGKSFKIKGNLKQHEKAHYGTSLPLRYKCEMCAKKYVRISELRDHMTRTHSDVESFQCDQCGKKFKILDKLKDHIRRAHILTKTLPHSCEFCDKRWPSKHDLKHHLISQHKLSMEAAKASAKIEKRSYFIVMPNGDRVYKPKPIRSKTCEYCGRTYARLEFLYTHLVKVHRKTEEEAKAITKLKTKRVLIKNGMSSSQEPKTSTTTEEETVVPLFTTYNQQQQQFPYNFNYFHPGFCIAVE